MFDMPVDIENEKIRDGINTELDNATESSSLTPYIALEKVRKILMPYHIHVPRYLFKDDEHGILTFEARQFGDIYGMKDDGQVYTKDEYPYLLYFEYQKNEIGMYDVFCEIIDRADLADIQKDLEEEGDDLMEGKVIPFPVKIKHSVEEQDTKKPDVEMPVGFLPSDDPPFIFKPEYTEKGKKIDESFFFKRKKNNHTFKPVHKMDEYEKLGLDDATTGTHQRLMQHYDYTPDESEVLRKRTLTSFRQKPTYDSKGKQLNRAPDEEISANRQSMDKIVNTRRTPEDLVVYHGVAKGYRKLLGISAKLGIRKIRLPHRISTSLNPDTADGFATDFDDQHESHGHVLVMHVPKGSRGAYSPYNSYAEQELHLGPGRLKIVGRHTIERMSQREKGRHKITYHYGHYVSDTDDIKESEILDEFVDLDSLSKAFVLHKRSLEKNLNMRRNAGVYDHVKRIYNRYGTQMAIGATIGAAATGGDIKGASVGMTIPMINPIASHVKSIIKSYKKIKSVKDRKQLKE